MALAVEAERNAEGEMLGSEHPADGIRLGAERQGGAHAVLPAFPVGGGLEVELDHGNLQVKTKKPESSRARAGSVIAHIRKIYVRIGRQCDYCRLAIQHRT